MPLRSKQVENVNVKMSHSSACTSELLSARTCWKEYCFLWSNDLSATVFFFLETDAVGFSTGSARWLRDAEGWGQLPSFEEEERKQC